MPIDDNKEHGSFWMYMENGVEPIGAMCDLNTTFSGAELTPGPVSVSEDIEITGTIEIDRKTMRKLKRIVLISALKFFFTPARRIKRC